MGQGRARASRGKPRASLGPSLGTATSVEKEEWAMRERPPGGSGGGGDPEQGRISPEPPSGRVCAASCRQGAPRSALPTPGLGAAESSWGKGGRGACDPAKPGPHQKARSDQRWWRPQLGPTGGQGLGQRVGAPGGGREIDRDWGGEGWMPGVAPGRQSLDIYQLGSSGTPIARSRWPGNLMFKSIP